MTDKVVGILGGGQLGRMLMHAASLLNIPVIILDDNEFAPAKQILPSPHPLPSSPSSPKTTSTSSPSSPSDSDSFPKHLKGSFTSPTSISTLASRVNVLTIEIEHVNVDALESAKREYGVEVHPDPETIRIVQDKFRQKCWLKGRGCPVGEFVGVRVGDAEGTAKGEGEVDIQDAIQTLGLPLMLKSRTLAYDGRGNHTLTSSSPDSIASAIASLSGGASSTRQLYAEKWVPYVMEIAVMVVRSKEGEVKAYPAVETVHRDSICHVVYAPLRVGAGVGGVGAGAGVSGAGVAGKAEEIAIQAVRGLSGAGVFGVEMFLLKDGTIYINEIAPRPHNSGHYTIESCHTSQYENHLRSILSLPLGSTKMKVPSAAMINIIGTGSSTGDTRAIEEFKIRALGVEGVSVHMYGKGECRKGRKMGHVTIVGESDAVVRLKVSELLNFLPSPSTPSPSPPTSLTPTLTQHSHPFPLASIIMGSDSDLPILLPTSQILSQFKIPYELTIVSAHRTPDRLFRYAKGLKDRGVRVVVAGAGGAAHLPGMVASLTSVPVVGVPVRATQLGGVDSLLSIVQMPRGIPVATVSINNGTNAGLLAVRILSAGIERLAGEMEVYMKRMEEEVERKVTKLEEVGWEGYSSSG